MVSPRLAYPPLTVVRIYQAGDRGRRPSNRFVQQSRREPETLRRTGPPDCPEIREEMKEIAGKRRRFGCRRAGVLLEREGMIMNHKTLYRRYREEGLSVKRRRGRKRVRGSRTPMPEAERINARWSPHFLSDSFGASRTFGILAVIDDCTRENLCLIADTGISGAPRVARGFDALVRIHGKPACIVGDNEFTGRAILKRADRNGAPGVTSTRASPARMPSPSRSTAACATKC